LHAIALVSFDSYTGAIAFL